MDLLHELAMIGLLDSVERRQQTVSNKHVAAAARRLLQALPLTSQPTTDSRERLAEMLARRAQAIADQRKLFAEKQAVVVPNGELAKKGKK